MKNLRLIPALLMLLFVSIQARANDKSEDLIKPEAAFAYSVHAIKDANKFALAFKNRTDAKVMVEIFNQEGKLVFKEVQSKEEMYKLYDLSQVGAGEYKVVIKSGDFRVEERVAVGMKPNAENLAFETLISPDVANEDKMRLAFSNATSDVNIQIADAGGKRIYNNTVSAATHYNQRFDMSHLAPGIYMITIKSGGNQVVKSYAVK